MPGRVLGTTDVLEKNKNSTPVPFEFHGPDIPLDQSVFATVAPRNKGEGERKKG